MNAVAQPRGGGDSHLSVSRKCFTQPKLFSEEVRAGLRSLRA